VGRSLAHAINGRGERSDRRLTRVRGQTAGHLDVAGEPTPHRSVFDMPKPSARGVERQAGRLALAQLQVDARTPQLQLCGLHRRLGNLASRELSEQYGPDPRAVL